MEIVLETKQFVIDLDGNSDENDVFYRYNIDGNLVWFSQDQKRGNIYSVSVRLTDNLYEYYDVWVERNGDKPFYPNDITIEIKKEKIKTEDVDRVVSNLHYVDKLCDAIMSIFKMEEHYGLWCEKHILRKG